MIRRARTDEDRLLSREWAAPLPLARACSIRLRIMRRVRIDCGNNQNWHSFDISLLYPLEKIGSNRHSVNFPSKWVYYCNVSYQLHVTYYN